YRKRPIWPRLQHHGGSSHWWGRRSRGRGWHWGLDSFGALASPASGEFARYGDTVIWLGRSQSEARVSRELKDHPREQCIAAVQQTHETSVSKSLTGSAAHSLLQETGLDHRSKRSPRWSRSRRCSGMTMARRRRVRQPRTWRARPTQANAKA